MKLTAYQEALMVFAKDWDYSQMSLWQPIMGNQYACVECLALSLSNYSWSHKPTCSGYLDTSEPCKAMLLWLLTGGM